MHDLSDRPTKEVVRYYVESGLFWTNKWEGCASCEMWYTFQKMMQHLDIKSVLNVGIGPAGQAGMWNFLLDKIFNAEEYFNVDIVEKFVEDANASNNPLINKSVVHDVREIGSIDKTFDLSFWSHGPEHVVREEWGGAFAELESVTNKIVILQCPWGSGYDYDHEHLSKSIEPEEFHAYGYETLHCGVKNSKDTNILAWKIK